MFWDIVGGWGHPCDSEWVSSARDVGQVENMSEVLVEPETNNPTCLDLEMKKGSSKLCALGFQQLQVQSGETPEWSSEIVSYKRWHVIISCQEVFGAKTLQWDFGISKKILPWNQDTHWWWTTMIHLRQMSWWNNEVDESCKTRRWCGGERCAKQQHE